MLEPVLPSMPSRSGRQPSARPTSGGRFPDGPTADTDIGLLAPGLHRFRQSDGMPPA